MWNDAERFGQQPAENATMRMPLRASAGQRLRPAQSCGLQYSHASAIPRQKRFRKKGGRGDGALRIGALLIASKVPLGIRFSAGAVADPEIVSPRRFLGYLLSAQKVTYKKL